MIVACREAWRIKHPKPKATRSREHAEPAEPMTTVAVPPELESTLGLQYPDEPVAARDLSAVTASHHQREAVSS
jgi:hypothetical protein